MFIVGHPGNPGNPQQKWMIWEDTSGSLPRLIASPCRTAVASPNAVTMTAGCWLCAKRVCPKMRETHWKPNIHGLCDYVKFCGKWMVHEQFSWGALFPYMAQHWGTKGPTQLYFSKKNLTIWKWGANNFEADAPRWRFHAVLGGNLSRRCGNLGGFHLWKHPRAEPSGLLSKFGSLQLLRRQKQVFETCPGGCCGGVGMLPPSGA